MTVATIIIKLELRLASNRLLINELAGAPV